MQKKQITSVLALVIIVSSLMLMLGTNMASTSSLGAFDAPLGQNSVHSEALNIIENPGFETGSFSPWVNEEGTTYNQIVDSGVYDGHYSLFLVSHISSAPYEPVTQKLAMNATLTENLTVSAAIYPEKTGTTCGQAGVSQFAIYFHNKETGQYSHIAYEWSGYTFPGNDLNSNTTYLRLLLFDWIPSTWNVLNRSVYHDYVSFFGVPTDMSQIEFYRVHILCHSSNGDPGDFLIDNVYLGNGSAPIIEPEPEPIPSGSNYVSNPGFESGSFSPWINQGGTVYNQIVDSIVYDGSYSLYLDSHYSSAPYEKVTQTLAVNASLSENLTLSAAIYPEKTGNTCGQAGNSEVDLWFHNKETGQTSFIAYEWSGYTFPGNDLNSNTSYLRLLLFDWTPFEWNVLNRSVYNDYVSFFGIPTDMSQIEFFKVLMLCHSSNGDPGDFYTDNVYLGNGSAPIIEPEPTTSTTSPDTTSIPTSVTWFTNITGPNGDWIMMVFVGGGGMGVIIIVIIIILTRKSGSSGDVSPPYSW